MTNDDELKALWARVEELERKAKPPEPFKPAPYQRFDPTEGMCMPRSTMLEMHRASGHVMGGVIHDNRAPTGRPGMIPSQQSTSPRSSAGDGTGWAREVPLSNPPGTPWVDALCIADDVKQRSKG